MIKNILLIVTTLSSFGYSQTITDPCYFDTYVRNHKAMVLAAEKFISKLDHSSNVHKSSANNIKIIPVVVHVIHDGGVSNISDAQIQSQIDVLNEDFRRKPATNGFGLGVDTEIEFCLAKKDPLGKCTNGIVRINSPLSNHQTYQRAQLKQLSYWDNNRYLNMYVVKNINNGNGILGYSSFPSGPPDEDGIVVKHNYFGKIGTASASLGRTTTHEIGHWFGLYHTFNNGCGTDTCLGGDLVCDTPPVANPNFGCPASVNSCTIDNLPDQIKNYLDYSNDNCKNMFTNGQKTRMQSTLISIRDTIWLQWNVDSTGCDSGFISPNCNVIADFVTLTQTICVGNTIVFCNKSQNNPTTYQWFFQGGSPATSSVANPTVTYSSLGVFQVKLIATNAYGTDSLMMNNYVSVSSPPVGQPLPYYEDFEASAFPPSGITIDNPDAGITWERDTIALAFQGNASAKINNLININYGQSDAMILPRFDFTTFTGIPYLYFKWAYAKSDPNYSDELIVLVSNNCGVTWNQVFYTTGNSMTTGTTQTTPYLPTTSTVWKTANINLNAYSTSSNVQIKIVNVTDGGNNLYVDNINLGSNITGLGEERMNDYSLVVYPNPAKNSFVIQLDLSKPNNVSYEIMDIAGRKIISSEAGNQSEGLQKFAVNTTGLANGIYFLKIKVDSELLTRKFLINK
jgi:PKD repeat protein